MNDFTLNRKIKWYQWVLLCLSWGITIVLGFVIFFMIRTTVRVLLFDFVMNEWMNQAVATLIEKVLVVTVGLVILSFIVFIQDYFYKGIGKNILLGRFLKVLGIGLLILFVFNFIVVLLSPQQGILLLYPGLELIIGAILTIYSFRALEKKS